MKVLALLLLFVAFDAEASSSERLEDPPPNYYHFSWQTDGLVLVSTGVAWTSITQIGNVSVNRTCPCDSTQINSLDRRTVHSHSQAAAAQSNMAAAALVPVPFILDAWNIRNIGAPWSTFGADVAVMSEAYLLSGALTEAFKISVQRPRPLLYDKPADDPNLEVTDNYRSFYSAHTSGVFSAGMAYASTYSLHNPSSKLRIAVYGVVIAAGSYIGSLRIQSGKHFISDVAAGALLGSFVGLSWPILHENMTFLGGQLYLTPTNSGLAIGYTKKIH